MSLLIGTSGWQYRHWRDVFYPKTVPQRLWLEYYAERFDIVEVNNAFYRLPERKNFEAWAERTPDEFVVAVKASRYLTHIRRLQEPKDPVDLLMERARGLGAKLGPVLVQLPPTLKLDLGNLEATLDAFDGRARVAVEFRHDSWFVPAVEKMLARYDAALVLADRGSRPITPIVRTASWGYVRLHEGAAKPLPCYGRDALRSWVERVAGLWPDDDDVYVFFNNDPRGCALRDARTMAHMARATGLTTTRVDPEVAVAS